MITVTAPTSQIGRLLLDLLIGRVELRVVARDPGRLPPSVLDSADVIEGSHSDAGVMSRALAGVDTVFWLVPPNPHAANVDEHYRQFTAGLCAAVDEQGVRRVVAVSTLGRGFPRRSGLLGAALAMDAQIESTGVAYRALRMPYFMENLLGQIPAILNQGVLALPNDITRRLLMVTTRDVADFAARVLLDEQWTGQDSLPVVGPDNLTPVEMAGVISRALGGQVHARHVPPEAYEQSLLGYGLSDAWARGLVDMAAAQDEGIYDADVANARRSPTAFAQWCNDTLEPAAHPAVSS